MKTCTQCGEVKPLTEFHRLANRPDGRRAECAVCARSRQKAWAKANRPTETGSVTRVCPHCVESFTYTKVTKRRMYCTERCRMLAADAMKSRHLGARQCECGSTDVAGVGKPVCPNCKKDKRDPVRARTKERRRRLRLYGITQEDLDRLLAVQGGRCAICRATDPGRESWDIDHDHACCPGKGSCGSCVRGLLCMNCNLLIGHAGDDPHRLELARRYLMAHEQRPLFPIPSSKESA